MAVSEQDVESTPTSDTLNATNDNPKEDVSCGNVSDSVQNSSEKSQPSNTNAESNKDLGKQEESRPTASEVSPMEGETNTPVGITDPQKQESECNANPEDSKPKDSGAEISAANCDTDSKQGDVKTDPRMLINDRPKYSAQLELQPNMKDPKSIDDLNDAKSQLSECHRRIHEMELEIKRLENEREELSAAFKEAETLRRQEEAKAQRLSAELTQVRHDYEKRLTIKEEEIEALRKHMQIEIEQLNMRVAEAEAKVKTEVARIKKKMQVQITELEMSLDAANKQNIDLQKTIKRQAQQITEITAHYDEVHRQLQQTVDQLGISQRRCQGLQSELEELRVTLEQVSRAKRAAETTVEECQTRINELTTINVNIASAKSKLESELAALQADYDELHKELRLADERATKVSIELKSTKDILIEEQERSVKIESIKKSLEIEVRNLQIRLEEVEANALAGGKRVIAKLEARIRDMEIEVEEEKRRHSETQKILRKKEHRVKELILQTEEDHKTITLLQDSVDKLTEKVKMYKRQLSEQEGMTQQNLTRVRRFQRELEAAEDRADQAESNLSLIRAKHRSWVTTSTVPGGVRQVFITEETSSSTTQQQY